MLFLEITYSLFLYSIFGFFHSFLASEKIKLVIKNKLGVRIAFFRLGYNLISVLIIYLIWKLLPDLHLVLYDMPYPFDIATLIIQLIGIIGFYWSAKYICIKEFLGFSQIDRYFQGIYNADDLDEYSVFLKTGPYRFSRHPIYFFSLVFLVFRPYMDLQYLLFLIASVIYFYIGSYFEEKKLLNKFGNEYLDYSSKVARIIPYKILRGTSE